MFLFPILKSPYTDTKHLSKFRLGHIQFFSNTSHIRDLNGHFKTIGRLSCAGQNRQGVVNERVIR